MWEARGPGNPTDSRQVGVGATSADRGGLTRREGSEGTFWGPALHLSGFGSHKPVVCRDLSMARLRDAVEAVL